MSNLIEFPCKHCGKHIQTDARYVGQQGACPHCGKQITVEAPAGQLLEPAPERPSRRASTEANTLLACLLGAGATVALYGVFLLIRGTYLGQLFTARGPIPFISTFVTCWGLSILALKYWAVKKQLQFAEHEMEFIPLQKGMQITSQNVDGFLLHLQRLPPAERDSILGERIRGALEHFRARHSVPEVQSYLASQAEIDASTVDGGYTLLRAFIWAVPILGFIGTVTGISDAVNALAGSLDNAGAEASAPAGGMGEQMILAMGLVTQGLATAFDTTFIALVQAIILLFPAEYLKRVEFGMMDRIEGFTNDALLRRLVDQPERQPLSPEIARLIEPAFQQHQKWLLEWQHKVSQLGDAVGRDFATHFQSLEGQLAKLTTKSGDEAVKISTAVGEMRECLGPFREASEAAAGGLRAALEEARLLQERLAENTRQTLLLNEQLAKRVDDSTAAAQPAGQLVAAAEALDRAARRLSDLGVAAEGGNGASDVPGPAGRKGWFFRK